MLLDDPQERPMNLVQKLISIVALLGLSLYAVASLTGIDHPHAAEPQAVAIPVDR